MSSLQGQVDALPTAEEFELLSAEEQDAVYAAAQEISDVYGSLSEEAQAEVDATRLEDFFAFFNGQIDETAITTQSQLQSALNGGGTVTLTQNINLTSQLTINTNVTLDLAGFTIDAQSKCRIFYINSGKNFTLKDSSANGTGCIRNGYQVDGGGVYVCGVFSMYSGTIANCVSTRNTTDYGGGGVYINYGAFYMYGGTITGCEAYDGGGIMSRYGTCVITGGTISNCVARSAGGALRSYEHDAQISNATITNCRAIWGGGADVYSATYTISNTSITGCQATNGGALLSNGNRGGFTYLTINNTYISGCHATNVGGAVYIMDNSAFIVNSGTITNCTSVNSGGSIYGESNTKYQMNGGQIYNCSTNGHGGAVCSYGALNIVGGSIYNCTATTNPLICYSHGGTNNVSTPTYTVKFNTNGAGTIANQTIIGSGRVTEPTEPTKNGYVFEGWYNGTTKWDFSTTVTSNMTLTAKFVEQTPENYPNLYYKVTLNDGKTLTYQYILKSTGGTVTQPTDPSKDGHIFEGWYNGTTEWDFSTTVTSNMTLTAKFVELTPENYPNLYYKVTLNDGETLTYQYILKSTGGKVTQPADPTKDGYVFEGWYKGENKWDFSTNVTSDMTLTAKFVELTPENYPNLYYKVTLNDGKTLSYQYILKSTGGTVTQPADPSKDNHIFEGWYKGATKWDFSTEVTEDMTLTAKFVELTPENYPNLYYKVTLNDGETLSYQYILKSEGGTVTQPTDPSKNGYIFEGWYNGTTKWNFSTNVTEDMTLTAKFVEQTPENSPNLYYKVTLDDGTNQTVQYIPKSTGGKATRPDDPTRNGHTFKGWYVDGTPWDFAANSIDRDITITANWKQVISSAEDINDAIIGGGPHIVVIEDDVGDGEVTIPDDTDVTIDINGKDVDVDITVNPGGTLIIKDSTGNGSYTGDITNDGTIAGGHISGDVINNGTITGEDTIITGSVTGDGTIDDTAMVCVTYIDGDILVTYALDREEIAEDQILRGQRAANRSTKARNGYRFSGWYIDEFEMDENEDIIDMQTVAYDFDQPVLEDIVLLAMWADVSAPEVKGIEDGKTYEGNVGFTVSDNDELGSVTVNGKPLTPNADGSYTLKPSDEKQVVRVTDASGNTTTITVTVTEKKNVATATNPPQTGDSTNLLLWFTTLTLCDAAMVCFVWYTKKQKAK